MIEALSRLNQYRSMWILVFFDLPTEKKVDRQRAAKFRKKLLNNGFAMFQFSIYTRFCPSRENAQTHTKRIKAMLPPKGKVAILQITDKQFGMIELFIGNDPKQHIPPPQQLELF